MIINLQTTKYDEIKKELVYYLVNEVKNSPWKEFDFTQDSNISFVLDVVIWLFLYYSWYMNVSVNEAFIDSAQLKKNILSIAKQLGYKPYRKSPSVIQGHLKFSNKYWERFLNNSISIITFPPGTRFIDDKSNIWSLPDRIDLYYDSVNNTWEKRDIKLYQGVYKKIEGIITYDNTFPNQYRTRIYDQNIANYSRYEEYLQVKVQTGRIINNEEEWEDYIEDSIFEAAGPNDSVFFMDEYVDFIELKFGDGIFGKRPDEGLKYEIEYFTTLGAPGNGSKFFKLVDDITFYNRPDFKVIASMIEFELLVDENGDSIYSSGGSEDETIESIRVNAPKFYTTKGRAVTTNDYEVLINSRGLYTWDINVWGGKYAVPIMPNVFCSAYFKEITEEVGATEFNNNGNFTWFPPPDSNGNPTGVIAELESYLSKYASDNSDIIWANPLFLFNEFKIYSYDLDISTDISVIDSVSTVIQEYFWGELTENVETGENYYERLKGIQMYEEFFSFSKILQNLDLIDGLIDIDIEWNTYFRIFDWMLNQISHLVDTNVKDGYYDYDYFITLPAIKPESLRWYDNPVYDSGVISNFNQAIRGGADNQIRFYANVNQLPENNDGVDDGEIIGNIESVIRRSYEQSIVKFNHDRLNRTFPIENTTLEDGRECRFYYKTKGKKFWCMREQIPYFLPEGLIWELG